MTDITNFGLEAVDMAYVVSQNNLNGTLYDYIELAATAVQFSYDWDSDSGTYKEVPYSTDADFVFNGVLGKPNNNTIQILDMSQSGTAQQVGFNVTFSTYSTATFTNNLSKQVYTQDTTQWVLPLLGTLSQIKPDKVDDQPQWMRKAVQTLINDYGDLFEINQVLIDLTNVEVNSSEQTGNLPAEFKKEYQGTQDWGLLLTLMADYISAHASTIFPSLPAMSTAVTAKQSADTLPSCTPTAAEFVIVPNSTTPSRSALVWALMTDGNNMPSSPSVGFAKVTFFSDDSTQGYVIISANKFVNFLQTELVAVTDGFGAAQYVNSIKGGNYDLVSWQAATLSNPPSPVAVQPTAPATTIASWSWVPSTFMTTATDSVKGGSATNHSWNNSSVDVGFAAYQLSNGCYNQLNLSGTLKFYVDFGNSVQGGLGKQWTSPTLSYPWQAGFSIETVGSGVGFVYNPATWTFSTTPIVDNSTTKGTWLNEPPTTDTLLTSILATPIADMSTALKKAVPISINALGAFIFAGGSTFEFSGPFVNSTLALVSTLQYQSPS